MPAAAASAASHGEALDDVLRQLETPAYDVTRLDLQGRRVLLRADLNVPLTPDHGVADAGRIMAVLPTIQMLLSKGSRLAIISHLGRPDPAKETLEQMRREASLQPVVDELARHLPPGVLGPKVVPSCCGIEAYGAVQALKPGQACVLENTRFHMGDADNSDDFAASLASLCDVFVSDGFGVCHRDQGSVTGVTKFAPSSYPGPLVRQEVHFLTALMAVPRRPLGVLLGGAKVADKIGVLRALTDKADVVMVGGRMAFTFLAALGVCVGDTQVETNKMKLALELVEHAKQRGVQLLLPCDALVSSSLAAPKDVHVVPLTPGCCTKEQPCIPDGHYGVDIGPATVQLFQEHMATCNTLFWNGPMGKFEVPEFAAGTRSIAETMAGLTDKGAITVLGGGDSAAAVTQMGLSNRFSHVSTGGGASLELVEGKGMPGLRALIGKNRGVPAAV